MITQEYLKSILQYNENTGEFVWLMALKRMKIGNIAGSITNGYIYVSLNKKKYLAHRLAWFYIYGKWPLNCIDHINGIRDDNRINNLRDVTPRENSQNRKEHRLGHLPGTTFNKQKNKWHSRYKLNNKSIHLGSFNTELEAHNTYITYIKENNL